MKRFENIELLHKMIEERWVNVQKHPSKDLYIFNYSKSAQYEKVWNEVTLQCRGLILDKEWNIVARPFLKFFNYEELAPEVVAEREKMSFQVWEKMDGSLGISYAIDGKVQIATRGSFASDQAVMANKILEKYPKIQEHYDEKFTFLFEIIYPENRIVVDYGQEEALVLLAIVDNDTGQEIDIEEYARIMEVRTPEKFDMPSIGELIALRANGKVNFEGFIVKFNDGFRMKLKMEEYVRLHSIVTGINSRNIWEYLKNRMPMENLLNAVPDEFYLWVEDTVKKLKEERMKILKTCEIDYQKISSTMNRKEVAEIFLKCKYPHMLFTRYMYENTVNYNAISQLISDLLYRAKVWEASWDLCYPKIAEQPFADSIKKK